jgi:RecJ-like exonuclease
MYGMDAATNDVTRMLQGRDRHDEKLPLVLLVGTGSTAESADGLGLLGVYGARRVVIDAAPADEAVADVSEVLLDADEPSDLSTGALAANVAAAVNDAVRDDLAHLPAVSYWTDPPEAYVTTAAEAGYDEDRVREMREAVALEAYYQSYEDKRELITDLLFDDDGGLAGHVSEQFRVKLEAEVDTAEANLETREAGGVRFAVLDTDSYTHRFDFPPTTLLLDELHRRNRTDDVPFVTVGVGTDELYVRSTDPVDVRAVAAAARETVPGAGITAFGVRDGRIEFLSGMREDVLNAVVAAVADQI